MVRFPEALILIVTFLICLYLAYTDIRWRKVQNRYTFGLLLFSLAWQFVFVFHYGTLTLWELVRIVFEALGIAFLLYYIGAWSPGDAKLYWALAVTIPASLLRLSAPFTLVTNIFVVYFVIMGGYVLLISSWREKRQVLADPLRPRMLLKLGYSFISFMGVSMLIGPLLPYKLDYFETIALFIVLYAIFDRFVKSTWQQAILGVCFLLSLYAISRNPLMNLTIIGVTLVVFLFCRYVLVSLSVTVLSTPVFITDLRPGMMPVERVVRDREGRYQAQVKQYSSFLSAVRGSREVEVVVDPEPMGLSEAEVAELRRIAVTGELAFLRVQRSFPFVPVILVGFVLTVLCRQVFVFTVMTYVWHIFR